MNGKSIAIEGIAGPVKKLSGGGASASARRSGLGLEESGLTPRLSDGRKINEIGGDMQEEGGNMHQHQHQHQRGIQDTRDDDGWSGTWAVGGAGGIQDTSALESRMWQERA